jgi:beta-glucanase (GH16 family)
MKLIQALATAALFCAAAGQLQSATWVYKPHLSDEFNSWSVDTGKWRVYHNEVRNKIFHDFRVIMRSDMVKPTEAKLLIQSKGTDGYTVTPVDPKLYLPKTTYNYLAGGIISKNTFGPNTALSARVKIEDNRSGNSFAFWLDGATVWPPELDIFEFPRGKFPKGNVYVATSHYGFDGGEIKGHDPKNVIVDEDQWNEYKITWTNSAVAWTLNGVEVHRVSGVGDIFNKKTGAKVGTYRKVPQEQMNVIMNAGVGMSDWFGKPSHILGRKRWSCEMQVDWFRVAKLE